MTGNFNSFCDPCVIRFVSHKVLAIFKRENNINTVRLAHPVTEILLQPGGSEATRLAPSKPGGRRVFTEVNWLKLGYILQHHDLVLTLLTEDAVCAVPFHWPRH